MSGGVGLKAVQCQRQRQRQASASVAVYGQVDDVVAHFDVFVWQHGVATPARADFRDSVASDESARLELLEAGPRGAETKLFARLGDRLDDTDGPYVVAVGLLSVVDRAGRAQEAQCDAIRGLRDIRVAVRAALDGQGGNAGELQEADDHFVREAVPGLHEVRDADLLRELVDRTPLRCSHRRAESRYRQNVGRAKCRARRGAL